MENGLKEIENKLLNALSLARTDFKLKEEDKAEFLACGEKHSVLSLLPDKEPIRKEVIAAQRKCVYQYYRLFFLTRSIIELLKTNGIETVILKGISFARYYNVEEYRKSGDVDLLLLDRNKMEMTKKVLLEHGYVYKKEELVHHHETFEKDGIEVEIHTSFNDPFDDRIANNYLDEVLANISKRVETVSINGIEFPVLERSYEALSMLLHMLSHFLRSGFGLKLLYDWTCFWNLKMDKDEEEEYQRIVDDLGLNGFNDLIDSSCVYYLGLDKQAKMDKEICDQFIKEVVKAEEFGKSSKERMVTLRGNSLIDYLREFHHQMHINFPDVGKVFILWPVLWIITLVRFIYNNITLRHVSLISIMKNTSERSSYMAKIRLFDHGKKQS